MFNFKSFSRQQKYLKPTHAASFSPSYVPTSRFEQIPGILKGRYNALKTSINIYFSEYVLSNAILTAYLTLPAKTSTANKSTALQSFYTGTRHAFNWTMAFVCLVLVMPLMFLIALAIKLDSTGPVFYCQQRVGINRRKINRRSTGIKLLSCQRNVERRESNIYGKPFQVCKFRSMVTDAEKKCGPIWASKDDPRITRMGRFLRKTRLDELPQLFNVLKGEMALVGPRPERHFFIEKLSNKIDGYLNRLDVKPGITGLAQVEAGYDTSLDDVKVKVRYDLKYIHNNSLKKDLLILLRTIGVVFGCRGM